MRKLFSALLCVALIVTMMPAMAFAGVQDTWDFNLTVSENNGSQYLQQNVIEVGFEVQSDNLTLKTAQSVVFAIDLEIFDVLKKDLSAIEITSTGAFVKVSGKAPSIFNELASSDAVDWGGSLYLAKSEDGKIGYVMIQPAQDDDSFECKTKCTLASIFLGLKSGKALSDISKSSIRFATAAELAMLNQSAAVVLTDGDQNNQQAFLKDGSADTLLVKPEIVYGFEVAKDPYTGTALAAPTAKKTGTQKDGVTLTAAVPEGETAEYGYAAENDAGKVSNWQSGTDFTGLKAGTWYFFARVAENSDHKAGGTSAATQVTIYEPVAVSYTAPTSMTVKTAIETMMPTVSGGNGTCSYAVKAGSRLPDGLSLNADTGAITGAPTAKANPSETIITATDGEGASAEYTISFPAVGLKQNSVQFVNPKDSFVQGQKVTFNASAASGAAVQYVYKAKTAEDSAYTATVPSEVGAYIVKAYVTESDEYAEAEATREFTIVERVVTEIAIKTEPTTKAYYVNDTLDLTGLVVTAKYNDGSTEEKTGAEVAASVTTFTQANEAQTVTISYGGKSADFRVSVARRDNAVAFQNPQSSFIETQKVSFAATATSGTVKYVYKEKTADDSTYSADVPSTPGNYTVKAYVEQSTEYKAAEATHDFEIIARAVTGITVKTQPEKTAYYVGETLDTTGLVIEASYNDGGKADIPAKSVETDVTNLREAAASKTVTVTYEGKTATFTISVSRRDNRVAFQNPSASFVETQKVSFTATATNGTVKYAYKAAGAADTEYTETVPTAVGSYVVKAYVEESAAYNAGEATHSFEIIAKAVTGITVTTPPTKTAYYVNDSFDAAGLTVKAAFNDGTFADLTKDDVTIENPDMTAAAASKTVTVTYEGKTATFTISISRRENQVTFRDPKDQFVFGQTVTFTAEATSGTVQYAYKKAGEEDTAYTASAPTAEGNYVVKAYVEESAEYKAASDTHAFAIIPKKVDSIAIKTAPAKTEYFVGESFDKTGLVITATYNDGEVKDVAADLVTVDADKLTEAAESKTVTVTYGGKTATFRIKVKAVELTKIEVTTAPKKTEYKAFERFDKTGMAVTASYNNGATADVTADCTISAYPQDRDSFRVGDTTVTVSYGGKTADITVTVAKADLDMSRVSWNYTAPFTYDGSAKTVSLTGLPAEVTDVKYSGNTGTYAGSYTASALLTYDTANYNLVTVPDKIWAIGAADQVITVPSEAQVLMIGHSLDLSGLANSSAPNAVLTFAAEGAGASIETDGKTLTASAAEGTVTIRVNAAAVNAGGSEAAEYNAAQEKTFTVTLTPKTPVTITGVTAASGLKYTGTPQAGYTGKPANADGYTGTYEIVYEGTGSTVYAETAEAPTNAGTYQVTIRVPEGNADFAGQKVLTFEIAKAEVSVPTVSGTYTYNAEEQTVVLKGFDENLMTVSGNKQTAAGSYTAAVSLKADAAANYKWAGTAETTVKLSWEIRKAKPTVSVNYTKITEKDKTLADAALTKETASVEGTLTWDDGDTTVVTQGKAYGWTFIPADTANYEVVTGKITPWANSYPIGGGGMLIPEKVSQDGSTTTADLTGDLVSKDSETAEAALDQQTGDKLIETALKNESESVLIQTKSKSAASGVKRTEIIIPVETLQKLADQTAASLILSTDAAGMELDHAAVEEITRQALDAKAETVRFTLAKDSGSEAAFELKAAADNGTEISGLNGNAAVTVPVPTALRGKKLVCIGYDENGWMYRAEGTYANGSFTFNVEAFGRFELMEESAAEAAITAQKESVKSMKLTLRSSQIRLKNGKKAIKLIWKGAEDMKLDGIQIYRSTRRTSGYGKKPLFTTTKDKYYNTSVKTGTKYYYKVRGFVTIDGEKIYTQYSTKAWRTVK